MLRSTVTVIWSVSVEVVPLVGSTLIQLLSSVIFHVRVPVPVLLMLKVLVVSLLPKSSAVGVTDKTATLIVNWKTSDHSPQFSPASLPRTCQ